MATAQRPSSSDLNHQLFAEAVLAADSALAQEQPDSRQAWSDYAQLAAALDSLEHSSLEERAAGIRALIRLAGHSVDRLTDQPLAVVIQSCLADFDQLSFDPTTQRYYQPGARLAVSMLEADAGWGILTNGRRWRLYQRASIQTLEHFYELDLAESLAQGAESLTVWARFFHSSAFDDPGSGLNALQRASANQREITLGWLSDQAQTTREQLGKLIDQAAREQFAVQPAAEEISDAALVLVIRCLWLLLAEAQALTPFQASKRSPLSLQALIDSPARTAKRLRSPWSWAALLKLFADLAQSVSQSADHDYAALFDAALAPLLHQVALDDQAVRQALLPLLDGPAGTFRDLDLQDLALVCDGLLGPPASPAFRQQRQMTDWLGSQTIKAIRQTQPAQTARLAVKICDPLMGCGSRLLAATAHLVLERLLDQPAAGGLAVQRQQVVDGCLYGVDPRPVAVATATWLLSSLSEFRARHLGDHLRIGQPGAGAWMDAILARAGQSRKLRRAAQGQLDMLTPDPALIDALPAELDYRLLADLVAASQHGLTIAPQLWPPLVRYVAGRRMGRVPAFEALLAEAQVIATREQFTHWELLFPEVFTAASGSSTGQQAGFDGLISAGDEAALSLLVGLAVRLLRSGGTLALLGPRSWLASDSGAPLRRTLAKQLRLTQILEASPPAAPDQQEPWIGLLAQPPNGLPPVAPDPAVAITRLDRADQPSGAAQSYHIPLRRFGPRAWSLERPEVQQLLDKLRRNGIPLASLPYGLPQPGTALDSAWIIDSATRNRLIERDPHSAALIVPYLAAATLRRWQPAPSERWVIGLYSSADHPWPWSESGAQAEAIFRQTFFGLYWHLKSRETTLRTQAANQPFWWEWPAGMSGLAPPLVLLPRRTQQPWVCFAETRLHPDHECLVWANADRYWLGWLASPVAWWLYQRLLPVDPAGFVALDHAKLAELPVGQPTPAARQSIEQVVEKLINLTTAQRVAVQELADWLRADFEVSQLSEQLKTLYTLDEASFVIAVRQQRHKLAIPLNPSAMRDLRAGYHQHAAILQLVAQEIGQLERELAQGIATTYRLNAADLATLRTTMPPAQPGSLLPWQTLDEGK